jgi:hypothetical protein
VKNGRERFLSALAAALGRFDEVLVYEGRGEPASSVVVRRLQPSVIFRGDRRNDRWCQIRNVVGDVLDVLLAEGLRGGRHAAVNVRPSLVFEGDTIGPVQPLCDRLNFTRAAV